MQWLVGLDLGERSLGALHLATWLAAHSRVGSEQHLVAAYVLYEHLRSALGEDRMGDVLSIARTELRRYAEQFVNPFAELHVVLAESAEDGLARETATAGFDGLVIGRAATREGRMPLRLGRVARRLLRRLPVPVMVVPRDLQRTDIGGGDILLATDLGESSVPAARFARDIASGLGRELLVVHVHEPIILLPDPDGEGTSIPVALPRPAPEAVDAWAEANELGRVRTRLVDGDTVERLLSTAVAEDAALLVCGSRRLTLVDRIFTSSMGTALARAADRAVVVVPPN